MHCELFPPDETAGNGKLGLLKTCRATYLEATKALYSTNTFAVYGVDNWVTFLYFSKAILPCRLASITALYINTPIECFEPIREGFKGSSYLEYNRKWKRMWDIISTEVEGLRVLTVHLKRTYSPLSGLTPEEAWMKPMLQVRGLKRFRFELTKSEAMPNWTEGYKNQVQALKLYLEAKLCTDGRDKFNTDNRVDVIAQAAQYENVGSLPRCRICR